MHFVPRFTDGQDFPYALGKIVCVGRNYAEHAKEMDSPVPSSPLFFIKPATAAVPLKNPISVEPSRGEVHFETELALLISQTLTDASPEEAEQAVAGIGLALDLTLRKVQAELKDKGHPWEVAKAFDGACPLSQFLRLSGPLDWSNLTFSLDIDEERRQTGHAKDMLFPIPELLAEMSRHFTLSPGDVVITGTPAGVGELPRNARLHFELNDWLELDTHVVP